MELSDGSGATLSQAESEPSQVQRKSDPLPWSQLSVALFVKTCDVLTALSMKPYNNEVRTTVPWANVGLICRYIQLVGGLTSR